MHRRSFCKATSAQANWAFIPTSSFAMASPSFMKKLFFAALTALLYAASYAADDTAAWSMAVATRPSDGHRIIYRIRSDFGPAFKRSEYPDRVIIEWNYKSDNGMPSSAERVSMDQLEDLLAPSVERKSFAVLTLVSTGEGLREWMYYTKSQTEFMSKVNEALRGRPKFPIEIDLWKDPKWSRFDEFSHSIKPQASTGITH